MSEPSARPTGRTDKSRVVRMRGSASRVEATPILPPIPTSLTSFVGREDVLATITTLLLSPATRLVTLTGPGGVGKTRVALEVACRIRDDTGIGVGFIDLAAVQDADLVLPAIARALNVVEGDARALLDLVSARIGAGACLLVLDNFEQVADAGPVLTTLLGACAGLTLLVTSRAVLRVSGEQVFPIPPLTLPAPGGEVEVVDAEAVRLFVARAGEVRPDITLSEATHPAIAEICARLDGLPLAIELAAARSNLLAPPAMLARLEQRLPLLTAGNRDQPARLQTMRNAIAWSYELLAEPEQAQFRRLGVFVNGFSAEAAAAVGETAAAPVPGGLDVLVDHSLVRTVMDGAAEPRYDMLEVIREFALAELAGRGELAATRDRHAAYYGALAARADGEVDGPEAESWLPRLDRDRANLHEALAWLVERGDAEGALRLATALWRYWRIRGYLTRGRDSLATALALPGDVPLPLRADALWKLGELQLYLGEYAAAHDHLEQSVATFDAAGDRHRMATSLHSLGNLMRIQRRFAEAQACFDRALELRRDARGDRRQLPLNSLGMLALDMGDLASARALFGEALGIAQQVGSQREIGTRSTNIARLELAEGHLAAAREMAERSLAISRAIGDQVGIAAVTELLGRIAHAMGEPLLSIEYFTTSLQLRLKLGLQRNLIECIEMVAGAVASLNAELATRMLAAADAARRSAGSTRLPLEEVEWNRAVAEARATLGDEAFDAACRDGQRLTLVAASLTAHAELDALLTSRGAGHAAHPGQGSPSGEPAPAGLTSRELDVLRLVVAGRTNREIAEALYISPATAKRHVTNILAKLQLRTRAAAISYALSTGLVDE